MSTVNDVIVSYGGDRKRYSRDFQTKEEFLDYLPSIGVLPQYYVKIEPLVHVIPLPPTWMKETSSSMPKSTRILDL